MRSARAGPRSTIWNNPTCLSRRIYVRRASNSTAPWQNAKGRSPARRRGGIVGDLAPLPSLWRAVFTQRHTVGESTRDGGLHRMPAVRRGLGALHFRHTRSRQAPFDRQAGERAELDASRSGRKSTAPEPSGDGEARSSARKPTDAYCELPELLPAALPEPAPLPVALVPEGRDDDVEPEPA